MSKNWPLSYTDGVGSSLHKKELVMGKGNHSQKNDKKNKKPKQDKTKTVVKK